MNYTKYLQSGAEPNGFKFTVESQAIRDAMTAYSDIQRAKYIIANYARLDLQIDINEYFAYFLKEKNEYIVEYYRGVTAERKTLASDQYNLRLAIFSILRNSLDELLTEFKLLKQRLFRKMRKQERFNEIKLSYFKSSSDKANLNNAQGNSKHASPLFIEQITKEETDLTNYREPKGIMNIFKNNETKNYEKTRQIIFELSDVMNLVQKKMYEQGEMAKQILFNSIKSVENIQEGNKELRKAQEYQKGRGICYGMIFMLLGLFLILYDYGL